MMLWTTVKLKLIRSQVPIKRRAPNIGRGDFPNDLMSVNLALLEDPVWNFISYDIVNACSVSSFKRKLEAVNLDFYTC